MICSGRIPLSLDLLRFLARSLAHAAALLVLVTYRPDELDRHHPLSQLLPLLVREAHAERIDLAPLAAAALRDLVRARYALGAPDEARLVAYLVRRTEGNALFATELLRTLEERGVVATGGATRSATWRRGGAAAAAADRGGAGGAARGGGGATAGRSPR